MLLNNNFMILFLIVIACSPITKQKDKQVEQIFLEGTWYLNAEELYHKIYFQDSIHIGLDTHIDTIFFYTYKLQGDTLSLYDDYGDLVNHNIILKLSRDSLIFENLLDKVGVQRYVRWQLSEE